MPFTCCAATAPVVAGWLRADEWLGELVKLLHPRDSCTTVVATERAQEQLRAHVTGAGDGSAKRCQAANVLRAKVTQPIGCRQRVQPNKELLLRPVRVTQEGLMVCAHVHFERITHDVLESLIMRLHALRKLVVERREVTEIDVQDGFVLCRHLCDATGHVGARRVVRVTGTKAHSFVGIFSLGHVFRRRERLKELQEAVPDAVSDGACVCRCTTGQHRHGCELFRVPRKSESACERPAGIFTP